MGAQYRQGMLTIGLADNFSNPDTFMPERWLGERPDFVHNPEAFIPFSSGIGICLGKPVALYNMK